MNTVLQDTDDVFGQSRLYLIYKLRLIASWRSDGTISLEIGRDLKTLGFSVQDWHESTDFATDPAGLAVFWNEFQEKDEVEAFRHLEAYIDQYFDEAEAIMFRRYEQDERDAESLDDEFQKIDDTEPGAMML